MDLTITATLDMSSVERLLTKYGINAGGKAQRFIATNLTRIFDPYVPLRSSALKNSAPRNLAPPYETVTYDGPYARRLYYNPQYNFNGAPLRGAYWAARAWADHKDTFVTDLQAYVGSL